MYINEVEQNTITKISKTIICIIHVKHLHEGMYMYLSTNSIFNCLEMLLLLVVIIYILLVVTYKLNEQF